MLAVALVRMGLIYHGARVGRPARAGGAGCGAVRLDRLDLPGGRRAGPGDDHRGPPAGDRCGDADGHRRHHRAQQSVGPVLFRTGWTGPGRSGCAERHDEP